MIDLHNQQIESQNYVIHVCPECGAENPDFKKGGYSNSGKQMVRCNHCNKRFVDDHGQLTYYSHQDSAKWDQLVKDTFDQIPIEKTAATLNSKRYIISTCKRNTLWATMNAVTHRVLFGLRT